MTSPTEFVLGSRASRLARVQAEWVQERLTEAHPGIIFEIRTFHSEGDRKLDADIADIGGKGVFTEELTRELQSGGIQAAVHSLKDLPVNQESGTSVLYPPRADARDAWVGRGGRAFDSLSSGSHVGTSSLRRAAQVRRLFPGVEIVPIRGNVETRLRKLQELELDGVVLASAGLDRLDLGEAITERLDPEQFVPSPGQGILGLECLDRGEAADVIKPLEDAEARDQALAERGFLAALEGSCTLPAGAHAVVNGERIQLRTLLISPDAQSLVENRGEAPRSEAADLGRRLAQETLSRGGDKIKAALS